MILNEKLQFGALVTMLATLNLAYMLTLITSTSFPQPNKKFKKLYGSNKTLNLTTSLSLSVLVHKYRKLNSIQFRLRFAHAPTEKPFAQTPSDESNFRCCSQLSHETT